MTDLTGSLIEVDGRPALRFERRLPHPIDRVWRAVSEPAELRQWFVVPVEWGPERGETFEAYGASGEITEVEPPRALAWDYGEEATVRSRARWRRHPAHLHPRRHRKREGAQHAAGWETYLARLDAHLEGGHLTEMEAHEDVGRV